MGGCGTSAGKARRCIVRLTFRNQPTRKDRAAANSTYLKYMGRESATLRDKPSWEEASRTRQYYTITPEGRKVLMGQEEAEKKIGGDQTFRIILSPEDPSVELDRLAQSFIYSSLYGVNGMGERSKGFICCNHYNTRHPHVHILVSRRPAGGGEDLRLPPSYIKGQAYREAGGICTLLSGTRNRREGLEDERRLVTSPVLCPLDKQLSRIQKKVGEGLATHHVIRNEDLERIPASRRKAARRRLVHLGKTRPDLVQKTDEGYRLAHDWTKCLEGEEFMKLSGLAGRRDVLVDNGPSKQPFRPYRGVVKDITLIDDFDEKVLFTIQDEDGQLHLLDHRMRIEKAEGLRGKEVEVTRKGRKAGVVTRGL